MQRELTALGRILEARSGRSSRSSAAPRSRTRSRLVEHLLAKVDALLIGGGMAFTFLRALGHGVGDSLVEPDRSRRRAARSTRRGAAAWRWCCRSTSVVADGLDSAQGHTVGVREIPAGQMGLDIGPRTVERFADALQRRAHDRVERPDGRFRKARVRRGDTRARSRGRGRGGILGDRRRRHRRRRHAAGVADQIGYISTAGGAFLEFLEGRKLPGVAALTDAGCMSTPLVVGNWKMHGTVAEARVLATGVRDGLKRPRGVEVAVCPPFTALAAVAEILAGSPIQLGAQNCHHEPSGALHGRDLGADARRARLPL